MTEKRFHWDWKTGRMKDTYSDFQATKDMRLIEQRINDACRSYEKQIAKLKEENEQLKQQLNRLYNYFEDWYSDMTSANDFSEIWDNVKEDERWGDDGNE